jgi:hypothetical protein
MRKDKLIRNAPLLVALSLGITISAAQAQGKLSLPGILKGALPQSSGERSGTDAAQQGGGAMAQPTQTVAVGGSGADGTVKLPAFTMSAPFNHDGDNGPGTSNGVFFGKIAIPNLTVNVHEKSDRQITLKIIGNLAQLSKAPRSFKVNNSYDPGHAIIEYRYDIQCYVKDGTLTLTSFGGVDGKITGTFSNLQWANTLAECKNLGASGSFEVQRAADR